MQGVVDAQDYAAAHDAEASDKCICEQVIRLQIVPLAEEENEGGGGVSHDLVAEIEAESPWEANQVASRTVEKEEADLWHVAASAYRVSNRFQRIPFNL